jgi:DNA-binding MarR family transcriptional regulator
VPSQNRKMREWAIAETELIHEIVATAERIAAARALDGEPIVRTDAVSSLLHAVERSQYCCCVSDVARLLGVRRQTAHEAARRAELSGAVELLKNPDDRRIVQVLLTRRGRSRLAATRSAEALWTHVLLNGLDTRQMAATTHVLRVIRHRLLRDERERKVPTGRD